MRLCDRRVATALSRVVSFEFYKTGAGWSLSFDKFRPVDREIERFRSGMRRVRAYRLR